MEGPQNGRLIDLAQTGDGREQRTDEGLRRRKEVGSQTKGEREDANLDSGEKPTRGRTLPYANGQRVARSAAAPVGIANRQNPGGYLRGSEGRRTARR